MEQPHDFVIADLECDDEDLQCVEILVGLPEHDQLDIAATIHGTPDLAILQLDRHAFDPFARPQPDVAGLCTASGQEIIPFPM